MFSRPALRKIFPARIFCCLIVSPIRHWKIHPDSILVFLASPPAANHPPRTWFQPPPRPCIHPPRFRLSNGLKEKNPSCSRKMPSFSDIKQQRKLRRFGLQGCFSPRFLSKVLPKATCQVLLWVTNSAAGLPWTEGKKVFVPVPVPHCVLETGKLSDT